MIILTNLKWGNCFSYGEDNEIQLDKDPITQLVGVNGAGKTSIPILIQEVLFGKNIKGIKKQDISNRYTDIPGYWIKLKFESYDDKYEIKLQRNKSKLTLTLLKNNGDISSHTAVATYKTISEIIGFSDFKMVSQLLYQSSNSNLEFLTATDTNRKKFLVSLLNLSKYLTIHESFKTANKDINKDIITAKAKLDHIGSWIAKHKKMDLTLMEEKILVFTPTNLIEEIADIKSRLKHIVDINKKIVTNNKYKKDLSELDVQTMGEPITFFDKDVVTKISEKIGGLKSSSNLAGETKKTFSNLEGINECPTCFQEVDSLKNDTIIKSAKEEIESYAEAINELKDELTEWENIRVNGVYKRKLEAEFIRLNNAIDLRVASETLDKNELSIELKDLQVQMRKAELETDHIIKHNSKAAAHNSKVDVIKSQLVEFAADLKKKERIYNKALDEKSYIEILKNAFGTNGLLSYKIESSVKVLEDSINDYLADFCFFRLVFTLEGEKLNVNIIDDEGTIISVDSLSTGELARVNISTVLAIRKVMSKLASSNINFLFLDEIVGVLDEEGKEKLTEILIDEQLNTFIVSHEATHPLIPKIRIDKINKMSRLSDG
jgi:DNA repair exonuclease SbcCD ATPase subunit